MTSLIGAHSDTFTSILKSHRGTVSKATLEELSLVTGVMCHSGVGQDWSNQDSTAVGSGMVHIQRLMLALIPHYCDRQVLRDYWAFTERLLRLLLRILSMYAENSARNTESILSIWQKNTSRLLSKYTDWYFPIRCGQDLYQTPCEEKAT